MTFFQYDFSRASQPATKSTHDMNAKICRELGLAIDKSELDDIIEKKRLKEKKEAEMKS
jgi:hypothetical protein